MPPKASGQQKTSKNTRLKMGAKWSGLTAFFILVLTAAPPVLAQGVSKSFKNMDLLGQDSIANRPLLLMIAMAVLALVPFVGMMVTSFVKIAVVLSITRQAIGTQQAPPTTVITGLAIILTVYVMQPVGLAIYNDTVEFMEQENVRKSEEAENKKSCRGVLRDFQTYDDSFQEQTNTLEKVKALVGQIILQSAKGGN